MQNNEQNHKVRQGLVDFLHDSMLIPVFAMFFPVVIISICRSDNGEIGPDTGKSDRPTAIHRDTRYRGAHQGNGNPENKRLAHRRVTIGIGHAQPIEVRIEALRPS